MESCTTRFRRAKGPDHRPLRASPTGGISCAERSRRSALLVPGYLGDSCEDEGWRGVLFSLPGSTTTNWPIMPASSCRRMWQWYM